MKTSGAQYKDHTCPDILPHLWWEMGTASLFSLLSLLSLESACEWPDDEAELANEDDEPWCVAFMSSDWLLPGWCSACRFEMDAAATHQERDF